MSHSLAAVFDGTPRHLAMTRIPTPSPIDGEILIRTAGCTLCGSDLHTAEGRRKVPVPTVLGHEIVGTIEAFGPTARREDVVGRALKVGDRVTWSIVADCGACPFCRDELPQKCVRSVKYGHEPMIDRLALTGGLAEHCLLASGSSLVLLPDELPLEVVCPANCATATVAGALAAAGDLVGRSILIIGAGMLGLTACAMASTLGAERVLCVEPSPERRETALLFGATEVAAPEEVADLVRRTADGRGVDRVIELSGNPAAFRNVWPTIRTGGRIILIGSVFPSEPVSLALEDVVRRCITIRGIHNYAPRDLVAATTFLERHHRDFPFASLVARWFPLSRTEEAFAFASETKAPRIGVRPD